MYWYYKFYKSITLIKWFFMWATFINIFFILLSYTVYRIFNKPIAKIYSNWFNITEEFFHKIYFSGILLANILFLIFSATPYIVLELFF